MRRRPLLRTLLAASLPMVVASAAVPASAATYSLTVTTLGRSGAKVSSTVTAVGVSNGGYYRFATGKAKTLPKGTYALLVSIDEGGVRDTLGGKIVTVSGRVATTFDARKGKAVKATLDSGPAATDSVQVDARVCALNSTFGNVEVSGTPGSIFVIPNTSKRLNFAYLQSWRGAEGYVVSGQTTGVPSSPGGAFRRAALANWYLRVRSGLAASSDTGLEVQPTPSAMNCQYRLWADLRTDDAPYALTAHLSPGHWDARTDNYAAPGDVGGWFVAHTLVGGKSYLQYFNTAAWGPSHHLPQVFQKKITYVADELIGDPFHDGGDTTPMGTYTLSKGGTVLKKQTFSTYGNSDPEFTRKITSAGWYTLNVDAHRYYPGLSFPSTILSPRITLNWRFYAKPTVSRVAPVFLTRFVPAGLNLANQAGPGSTTSVAVTLDRSSQSPDVPFPKLSPKSVRFWASYDGGTTWHAVALAKSGSTWTAKVVNPASGAVSLRSKVLDASGNSSVETIYRAYAIS